MASVVVVRRLSPLFFRSCVTHHPACHQPAPLSIHPLHSRASIHPSIHPSNGARTSSSLLPPFRRSTTQLDGAFSFVSSLSRKSSTSFDRVAATADSNVQNILCRSFSFTYSAPSDSDSRRGCRIVASFSRNLHTHT